MQFGKLPQTIYRKTVLGACKDVPEKTLFTRFPGERCSGTFTGHNQVVVSATAVTPGESHRQARYGVALAVNDVAAHGGKLTALSFLMQFPATEPLEPTALLRHTMDFCREYDLPLSNVQTEVSPAVTCPLVQVEAIGLGERERLLYPAQIGAGEDILLCGRIGTEGMLRILDEGERELQDYFPDTFLKSCRELSGELMPREALQLVLDCRETCGVSAIQQIGSGGILGTLWEIGEVADIGLSVRMADMPIHQQTVEVCEYYGVDPYYMTSAGTCLLFAKDGEKLAERLQRKGVCVRLIGRTLSERTRTILTCDNDTRYLDRPKGDAWLNWWGERRQTQGAGKEKRQLSGESDCRA